MTALAAEGQVLQQGETLFALNAEPTVLLIGSTPAYRELSTSSENGPEILQLEQGLLALGYDPGTVDEEYTAATANAVERWEADLKRTNPDGIVQLGEVVFSSGPVRVGTHAVAVGETVSAGSRILEVTGTARVVTLDLDAARQDLLKPDDKVQVTFSNGASVEGTVSSIGKVATTPSSDGGTAGSTTSDDSTVSVIVALPEDPNIPDLDQAPVTVGIAQEQRQDVLAVPVTALLALAEGGYGLEVVEPSGATKTVPVRTGTYADGYVEVSGDGISAGTKVVNG